MNYKDHFKQQLINEMAMSGDAYDSAVRGWIAGGRKTGKGMKYLRQIHSPTIYDLNDRGEIVDTGDEVPDMMGIHGLMGGHYRDRQYNARTGRRAERANREAGRGPDVYYNRGDLNAFHNYMSRIVKPEDDQEIMDTLTDYPSGIVGGIGGNYEPEMPDAYLEAPGAGWRINPTKGRYRWKPKDIGGVGGDPLFNAFS